MTRLTLRLPDEIYRLLKSRQRASGQSLNELIVRAIERALGDEDSELADEKQRIRAALGDIVLDIDPAIWPTAEQPPRGQEEVLALLPHLDPPLSQDIIRDRGEY